jgi:hypothetical protein
MAIRIQHEAIGIPFSRDNDRTKYGQALALQQRNDDNSTRQRLQDYQYDTQRAYGNQGLRGGRYAVGAQPAMMDNPSDYVDQMIASGQFAPGDARYLQASLAARSAIMNNEELDATQRAEGLRKIDSRIVRSMGNMRTPMPQPTVTDQFNQRRYAEGGRQWLQNSKGDFDEITPQSQPQAPSTAREAFNQNPKMEADYLKMAGDYLLDPENPGARPDRNKLWDKAEELWGIDQMRRRGPAPTQSTMPAGDNPMVPPARPVTGSSQYVGKQFAEGQGVLPPSRGAQASTGKGYIFIKPSGRSVTESVGMPSDPPAAASPANPWEGVVSPTGQPMTADTQYDMQNSDRGPGINFFDPENPTYAAMRAPQMQQPQAAPQYAGQAGLGGVDFGVNKQTGNNVSASVRPGGTMLQYDEPYSVRPPVTDEDFKKYRKAPASPGEMVGTQDAFRAQQAAAATPIIPAPVQQFYEQQQLPGIKSAIESFYDKNATDEVKDKAADYLLSNGVDLGVIENQKPPAAKTPSQNSGFQYPRDESGSVDTTAAHNWWLDPLRKAIGNESSWKEYLTGNAESESATATQPTQAPDQTAPSRSKLLDKKQASQSKSAPTSKYGTPMFSSDLGQQLDESMKDVQPSTPLTSSTRSPVLPQPFEPQAKRFMDLMKTYAGKQAPAVSSAILSVYDLGIPEEERVATIKKLMEMGIDVVGIENQAKARIEAEMNPQPASGRKPTKKSKWKNRKDNPEFFGS